MNATTQANIEIATLEMIMQPTLQAAGLDNSFYTSHATFLAERDQLFSTGWAGFMFASQLPKNNRVKPVNFMGLPLLIVNQDDKIHIFHNVCRHRGHQLVLEEGELNRAISCPYHRWTYGGDGSLLATPHIGGVNTHETPGFDKEKYGLVPVNHGIFMNLVYINIDNKAEPLEQYLKPLTDRWKRFLGNDGLEQMVAGESDNTWTTTAKSNWKLAVENYCEAYHLPFVHPELNSYSPLNLHYSIEIDDNFSGQGTTNYAPVATEAEGQESSLPPFKSWNEDDLKCGEYLAIYPNVLLGIQSDFAFSILLTPISENETHEELEVSFVGKEAASEDRYQQCRKDASGNWTIVFEQDIEPIENMQKGRQSPGFDGGHFSPALDVATHHFHRWVASKFINA